MTEQQSAFSLSYAENGVAWLKIDVPNEKMNTLQAQFGEQVSAVLEELKSKNDIKGMVVYSGKPDNFVAGADIRMLAACTTAEEAASLAEQGRSCLLNWKIYHSIPSLPFMAHVWVVGWSLLWLVIAVFVQMMTRPALVCLKSNLACCRVLVVPSVCLA